MSTSLTPQVDAPRVEELDATPVSAPRPEPGPVGAIRRHRQRLVAVTTLVLFSTALAIVVWPGRMSADTIVQIEQLRAGEYIDWHAALLLVLWRPFWVLGVGPGWVMWAALLAFVLGLYGLLRVRFSRGASVIGAMVITLLPPVVGLVIYLGRDMWFAAFFFVACAALVKIATSTGRSRVAWLVCLVLAVWLMQAARQNALPTGGLLIFAAAWMSPTSGGSDRQGNRRWRRLVRATAVTALAGLAILGSQAMMRRTFDVLSTHPEQALFIYDVAAISHAEREVLFDPEIYPDRDLADLDARFDPSFMHGYVFGPNPVIQWPVPNDLIDDLRADWVDAVLDHPGAYLSARMTLWLEQIGLTEPSAWVVHPGVDANPWGYFAANPALDKELSEYILLFADNDTLDGGIVFAVWPYLLVLVGGVAYLWSRRPLYAILGWICVSCLLYQVSLFFGLMGAAYRLNVHCVVVALVVGAVFGADLVARLWGTLHAGPDGDHSSSDGHDVRDEHHAIAPEATVG